VPNDAPLKPLHLESSLSATKLAPFDAMSTDALISSLAPRRKDCLKAKSDGTIMDGHHRIHILRQPGIDVDKLPREIVDSDLDLPGDR
jgi:hypothetical protein